MYNFTIRIHKPDSPTCLADIQEITISGITILSKRSKFEEPCEHNGNQKKFGYSLELPKKFAKVSGSNSYPRLAFNGNYIDIRVKNFPRYPAFYQDKYAARNCLNGWGYTNYINKGFPNYLLYRKIEIL